MCPAYNLDIFLNDCSNPSKVIIRPEAKKDADRIFKLRTPEDILEALYNRELQNWDFINTKPLEKSSFSIPVNVDAYNFEFIDKYGYFAFYQNPNNQKWVIKSFHEPDKGSTTFIEDTSIGLLLTQIKEQLQAKDPK